MRGYVQRGSSVNIFEAFPSSMHNGVTRGGELIVGISFDSATTVHSYVVTKKGITTFDFPAPGVTFTEVWDVNPSGNNCRLLQPGYVTCFVLDAKWVQDHRRGEMHFGPGSSESIPREHGGQLRDRNNRIHGFLIRETNVD